MASLVTEPWIEEADGGGSGIDRSKTAGRGGRVSSLEADEGGCKFGSELVISFDDL